MKLGKGKYKGAKTEHANTTDGQASDRQKRKIRKKGKEKKKKRRKKERKETKRPVHPLSKTTPHVRASFWHECLPALAKGAFGYSITVVATAVLASNRFGSGMVAD